MIASRRLLDAVHHCREESRAVPGGRHCPAPQPADGRGTPPPEDTVAALARYAVGRGWATEEQLRLSHLEVCALAYGLDPAGRLSLYDAEREGGYAAGLDRAGALAGAVREAVSAPGGGVSVRSTGWVCDNPRCGLALWDAEARAAHRCERSE